MTERDDPKTEAIFKALRDIEGIDDKLMGRPEVAHLPSVLGEDELPGAIVSSTANVLLVATDRRVLHIERSWRNDSISKVNSYAYEAMETFRADMGFLAPGLSVTIDGRVKTLIADKKERQRFANYVRARIGMEPQIVSASERSRRKVPWFVGSVLIVVAAVAIVLVFGSGGDETPTPAPAAPSSTSVATPRATPVPISAQEYKRTTIILFNELLSMVEDGVVSPLGYDLGFNKGNPRANRWRQNVETLRDSAGTGAGGLLFSEQCFEFSDTLGDDVCGYELLTFVNLIVFDKWDEYQKLAEKFSRISEEQ